MERGRLRRIFGKVATAVAVVATVAFYALGFQIGAGFYHQWQENKAPTAVTQVEHVDHTANLPWAAAGVAGAVAYGAGFAGIAAGKKRDTYGYGGYSSYSSSNDDGFLWGYVLGSSGRSGGSSSSSSSKDNGGAAAALVIIGAAALAAGATVVSYKAVKANYFTGEPPLSASKNRTSLEELSASKSFKRFNQPAEKPEPITDTVVKPEPAATETPATPTTATTNDNAPDLELVKRWKPFAL